MNGYKEKWMLYSIEFPSYNQHTKKGKFLFPISIPLELENVEVWRWAWCRVKNMNI